MNNNRSYVRKHPTRLSLPDIKKEETFIDNSNICKDINKEQVDLPNSNTLLQESLDEFEINKRVQFSKDITIVNKNNKLTKRHSFPFNDPLTFKKQQSNFLSTLSTKTITNHSITETTHYHSTINRTLSISTNSSSSVTPSLSSNTVIEQRYPSSTNQIRLSSLEFNSSLSEFDRKNLDDIREIIPDEFEKLVPTFLKLGVITFPKIFFQNNNQQEQMTTEQLIERHYLFSLIKKDQDNIQYKRHIEHLYGNLLPQHNHLLLRESLSFKGQLALLYTYQDQIQQELNKKIKYWKTIPMISIKTNYSEYSYSTNKSSITDNSFRIRKKSLKSYYSIKSNTNLSLTIDQNSLQILIPDHIDNQWKRKSIVHIIEQGIILLDYIRSLSLPILPNISYNQHNIYDDDKINIVKAFKRWLFLCFTLYAQD